MKTVKKLLFIILMTATLTLMPLSAFAESTSGTPEVNLKAKYSDLGRFFNITVTTDISDYTDSASIMVGAYKNNILERVMLKTMVDSKETNTFGSVNYALESNEQPEDYEFKAFTFSDEVTPVLSSVSIKGADAEKYVNPAAIIESSGNKDDRSAEIEAALSQYGKVLLGKGQFYVSGITMPKGTMLCGSGAISEIILLDSAESGAAITCSGENTVSDMTLNGGLKAKPTSSVLGSRDGIFCPEKAPQVIISGVNVSGFSGSGIHILKTGFHELNSALILNCHITYCGAGINFDEKAEYGVVSNVVCVRNYYGLKNDGGNNKFSSCGLDGNTYGFYMNAEKIESPNNGHGSCVGCTFNHNDTAIYIRRLNNGFMFSGCQVFFGKIECWISAGVQFANCQFGGGMNILAAYGQVTRFSDCMFANSAPPTFKIDGEKRSKIIITDCYDISGNPITFENQ